MQTVGDWVERRRLPLLAAFSVVYFALSLRLASTSSFWFDELFTFYISSRPGPERLELLRLGLDHQPPTFYALSAFLLQIIPNPHVALALPQIIGVWAACLGTYVFVSRRSSALFGLLAMLVLVNTLAYHYALEARPYGLATGFAALALLMWQLAADGQSRTLTLPALSLMLFGGVSSHYYAVLMFVPIAVGELTRLVARRRIDWGMLAAGTGGAILSAVYLPFVTGSVGGFEANNWAAPLPRKLYNEYLSLFFDLTAPVMLLFVLMTLALMLFRADPDPDDDRDHVALPIPDLAAALSLFALPAVQYIVAATVTNKMHERYVLQTTVGFAVLAAFLVYIASRRHAWIGVLVTSVALLDFGVHVGPRLARRDAVPGSIVERLAAEAPSGSPIVIDNAMQLLPVAHYSSPRFRARLYYPVDPEAARRFATFPPPKGGQNWLRNQEYMPIQAVPFHELLSAHSEFLLYSTNATSEWVLKKMLAEGATALLVAQEGRHWMYRIRLPGPELGHRSERVSTSPTVSSIR